MHALHIQNINLDLNKHLLHIEPTSPFQWKIIEVFFIIACKSMISSSKQRQEYNNLATILREKLKGAHECSKSI